MKNNTGNRFLALEQRLESQIRQRPSNLAGAKSYWSFAKTAYPGGKAWPGNRRLPASVNSEEYRNLDVLIREKMVHFAKKYVNQVSRSSKPIKQRLDLNSLGAMRAGWLACKDFFVVTMIMAFQKLDIPFHYLAEIRRKNEVLYVSSKDGCSVDLLIRYSKMYIGFLKKYTESVQLSDLKVGDVFLHIGGYEGASGHVRLVTKVFEKNNVPWVEVAEGHRSPTNSNVNEQNVANQEAYLPELRAYSVQSLFDENNLHNGGVSRMKWELFWKENAFSSFARWPKVNRVKKHWSSSAEKQRLRNNEEFYKPIVAIIGNY